MHHENKNAINPEYVCNTEYLILKYNEYVMLNAALNMQYFFFLFCGISILCLYLSYLSLSSSEGFDKLSPMVVVTNVFALVVLGFVGVVTYIVTAPVFTFLQEGYERVN